MAVLWKDSFQIGKVCISQWQWHTIPSTLICSIKYVVKILEPRIETTHLKLGNWRLWSTCKKPHKQIISVHNKMSIAKGLWASCSNFSKWWVWRNFILDNPESIPITVIQVIDFHMPCVGCPRICFTGEYIHFQLCYRGKYLNWIKYLVIIRK